MKQEKTQGELYKEAQKYSKWGAILIIMGVLLAVFASPFWLSGALFIIFPFLCLIIGGVILFFLSCYKVIGGLRIVESIIFRKKLIIILIINIIVLILVLYLWLGNTFIELFKEFTR